MTYYNIRNLYNRNLIIVIFVLSIAIVANSLTKPLIKNKYKAFKQQLGIKTSRSLAGRSG